METKLVLLPHLQSWNGTVLELNLLTIPRGGSPLEPLTTGSSSFAAANFVFDVHLELGLDILPTPPGTTTATIASGAVSSAIPIFNEFESLFQIDPIPKKAVIDPSNRVRKYAPLSYRNLPSYAPGRTNVVVTDDTYGCALKRPRKYKPVPPTSPLISWGKIIAFILRNPDTARAAGLIRSLKIPVAHPDDLKAGGFVYATLAPNSDGAALLQGPGGLKVYAARIPPTGSPRDLFTPVLFPVVSPLPAANYDEKFAEVEDYSDGWAKSVHCSQPQQLDHTNEEQDGSRPVAEAGVQLGWDDEQVTIWMDRQLALDTEAADSPIGVSGYRIDAKISTETNWHSLMYASGPINITGISLPPFNGELKVETHPVQLDADTKGDYWLPMYFVTWTGTSLAGSDPDRRRIAGDPDPGPGPGINANPVDISLLYGKSYQFRVRFVDHTFGGPTIKSKPYNPGPNPVAQLDFRRWIRPLKPILVNKLPSTPDPASTPASLEFRRPLLGSPAVICTGKYPDAIAGLIADVPTAKAETRPVGLADLDVDRLQIVVQVKALENDPVGSDGGFVPLYTAKRPFPAGATDSLTIELAWSDDHDVAHIHDTGSGPLVVPTARLVRLVVSSLCKEDVQNLYFGADDVRLGPSRMIQLVKRAADERKIFKDESASQRFSAFYVQPDLPVAQNFSAQFGTASSTQRPSDIATRFATALNIRNDGLTFRAQPGRRVVFACSSALHYVLGPDRASITFSSQSDLALHWITAIRLIIDRDWSWDGIPENGISIQRDQNKTESFGLPRIVNDDALPNADRTETEILFIDVIDPKPASGALPQLLHPVYTISVDFYGAPKRDDPLSLAIDLPLTTPPTQVPKIVSAGIAMSPYEAAADYSSTSDRQRALWIELESPVLDSRDSFFARVLSYAPDPLLTERGAVPSSSYNPPAEPPLPLDPEPVRRIVQQQADDSAGLYAMQRLIPSDSPYHWALPIPPGMSAESPQMFGFFTYELRVGHSTVWSTAQGRFGPPIRAIEVNAPFADAIFNSTSVRSIRPNTYMWIILYAQVAQIDGAAHRNIMLSRHRATYSEKWWRANEGHTAFAAGEINLADVMGRLAALGLDHHASLSVIAVELLPQNSDRIDPLGADLGSMRILRTSRLTPVPPSC
ncbi:MAG: hypothetical protein M1839_003293 [Geoglossum umbratile]|nr:MAG: hypothetical protein M1839_003293 [Geoglossum umbratile]